MLAVLPSPELFFLVIACGALFVALTLIEDRTLRQKRAAQITAGVGFAIAAGSIAMLVSIIVFDL